MNSVKTDKDETFFPNHSYLKNLQNKINNSSYSNYAARINTSKNIPAKNNIYSWINSDHFQLKAFFITLTIFTVPLILFIVFISAMNQKFENIALISLIAYALFYDILRRYIVSCLKSKKLVKTFIIENDELKRKLKEKRHKKN